MTNISVEIYEKSESYCRYCESVGRVFDKWLKQSSDDITTDFFSAEENSDMLSELGAQQAPVYIVRRDGNTSVISGNNPDLLIDTLNGKSSIWD